MKAWRSRVTGCLGPNVYPQEPDGGWGWVVAGAFFFVEAFTYGFIKSFGVFLPDLIRDFGESNSRVSWTISICVFVMTFTAPLSSMLTGRFGYRLVVIAGGVLTCLGTVATAFTSSINQMYATMGISGLGYCLTFLPTVTILSLYFNRRRSLVTAVASTGESFSIFALAPAFAALKEHLGWRYCLLLAGLLQSSLVVCGVLLRPIVLKPERAEGPGPEGPGPEEPLTGPLENTFALENELTCTSISSGDSGLQSMSASCPVLAVEEKFPPIAEEVPLKRAEGLQGAPVSARPRLLDFSTLQDGGFLCYAAFGLFATLGFFAPQLYVIPLGVSRGVATEHTPVLLSTMAVAEVLGRLCVGVLLGRLPVRKLYALGVCVAALALVLAAFPSAAGFWGLSTCCALFGFLLGTVCSTHIPMLAEDDVVGVERMPAAVGVYVFIQSFAGLAGPPLGGFLVDLTQNYGSAFYSCAAGMALGAVFLGCVLPARRAACLPGPPRAGDTPSKDAALQDAPVDFVELDLAPDASPAELETSQIGTWGEGGCLNTSGADAGSREQMRTNENVRC
ncbi:solute carrier family 16 member 6b [Paramormyrops kingsleyae]|uniref:Monocarboxylate transporter 7 n=1 Tax=Paramormyrops kingsleyae TaxID=1676925 RepID=A0A3B3QKM0_9TELE|nr:monocarboxylate transporter 7-like [Paramormyrops kingsleyae]XP_023692763.1 monocarboxylate transporter 7-like [Paramormyrops kingsleyae]